MQLNGSRFAVLVVSCVIMGCSTAKLDLVVESEVPEPVVEPLPLALGVYYSDEFRDFIYTEQADDRKDWRVDNRTPRLSLFSGVLSSMFNVVELTDKEAVSRDDISVDAVLEPKVVDMQLALPEETKMEFYEAWLKYELKLYRPEGSLIDQWQIAGYGKASSESYGGATEGLNAAIDSALRDVGAKMSLEFTTNSGVTKWLCEKQKCSEIIEN